MTMPWYAVALPELSEAAHFRIGIVQLEFIQEKIMTPQDFEHQGLGMAACFEWLDKLDYMRIKKLLDVALVDATQEEVFAKYTISDVAEKLADAMSLILYSRTVEQQVEHRQKEYVEQIRKLAEKRAADDAQ